MNQEKIGKFIKAIREENNLTQKEFADKLGVTFQAVSKWENGKNVPDIGILKQMSEEFHVNIDEILQGERNENKREDKKKNWYPFIILFLILFIIGIVIFTKGTNNDYEFKTISSKCSDFIITGSAAYNKEKASIYIANVEFCGKEDKTVYKEITCNLYESFENTKTLISNCSKKNNATLEEYLKELNMKVDHYSSNCKNMTSNSLVLEIQALNEENKTITYNIPLKLNDNCKE